MPRKPNRDRDTVPLENVDLDSEPPTEITPSREVEPDPTTDPGSPRYDSEPPTEPGTDLSKELKNDLPRDPDTKTQH